MQSIAADRPGFLPYSTAPTPFFYQDDVRFTCSLLLASPTPSETQPCDVACGGGPHLLDGPGGLRDHGGLHDFIVNLRDHGGLHIVVHHDGLPCGYGAPDGAVALSPWSGLRDHGGPGTGCRTSPQRRANLVASIVLLLLSTERHGGLGNHGRFDKTHRAHASAHQRLPCAATLNALMAFTQVVPYPHPPVPNSPALPPGRALATSAACRTSVSLPASLDACCPSLTSVLRAPRPARWPSSLVCRTSGAFRATPLVT